MEGIFRGFWRRNGVVIALVCKFVCVYIYIYARGIYYAGGGVISEGAVVYNVNEWNPPLIHKFSHVIICNFMVYYSILFKLNIIREYTISICVNNFFILKDHFKIPEILSLLKYFSFY